MTTGADSIAPKDLRQLAGLVRQRTGIRLGPAHQAMIQARLSRRLRQSGQPDFASYASFVQTAPGAAELDAMIVALTTNFTQFLRQRHHFIHLRDTVLPALIATARCGQPLRLWSAGASSGQEAFSIAMMVAEKASDFARLDIRILATDIDPRMIAAGREAHYDAEAMALVPEGLRARFFLAEPDGWRVRPDLRRLVSFREHNLHGPWPMRRLFDIVFCRNVAIYFDPPARDRLWRRMEAQIAPGGWLYLGHSERITPGEGGRLDPVALTTYRRRVEPIPPDHKPESRLHGEQACH